MIAFIDAFRDRFGVEFICTTLAHHRQGGFMTSRGYRAAKKRLPSKRLVRDCELILVSLSSFLCKWFGFLVGWETLWVV